MSYSGYVCVPYLHSKEFSDLKKSWMASSNIEAMYFVTGTFSSESKLYFSSASSQYILAKFKDNQQIINKLDTCSQEKTSFIFNIRDEFFQREVNNETNFVTIYYLEYIESMEDLQQIANLLLKKEKIRIGGIGFMNIIDAVSPKFTFPYAENILIVEVASEKSHQSVKKYCEQTKRDANRKGLTITNLLNLSILEKIK
jgi:hypothetical protein